jgi:predicted transposase YdaD
MAGAATFEEVFTRAGLIPQWLERGMVKGVEQGLKKGREEGLERGLEKGREEIARTLLSRGWTVEETAEVTKLPVEKVRFCRP